MTRMLQVLLAPFFLVKPRNNLFPPQRTSLERAMQPCQPTVVVGCDRDPFMYDVPACSSATGAAHDAVIGA
jgi:hypothetical protein